MAKLPLKTIGLILGGLTGFLLLHPSVMLVLSFVTTAGGGQLPPTGGILSFLRLVFSPEMLPMSLALILFSALMGLLIGMVFERERRLDALRHENERREAVLGAVRQLVMVLSHHFLNSALVIGVNAKRLRNGTREEDRSEALDRINAQIMKMESVVSTMREIQFEEMLDGNDTDYERIIEINSQLEQHIAETNEEKN